jgi:hypothetical protein
MRWEWHVVCMGEKRNVYRDLVGIQKEKDLGADGTIILKWILEEQDVVV